MIFRHPLKPAADGAHTRVRRGLNTRDEAEADRLLVQLNTILSDRTYWTPAAKERAAREFDSRVVSIFFDKLNPVSDDPWTVRDEFMPLPTRADGYSRVVLLGSTGAGKTTLLRQFIGSDPRLERFPSTSKSKTTTADMEIILTDGAFEAVVTFLSYERTRTYVEECVTAAISLAAEDADRRRVLGAFLEHQEQRFRLSFILGSLSDQQVDEEDSWGDEAGGSAADRGEDEGEVDVATKVEMEARLRGFLESIIRIGARVRGELEGSIGESIAKLKADDLEAFLELVEERVRDDEEMQALVDDVLDEVRTRFQFLDPAPEATSDSGWPIRWRIVSDDRAKFIRAINRLTSNYAPNFGRLLTPLVNGIRVRGPFVPTWMDTSQRPRLVLLDGEGLGHTPDSASSLPTRVTKLFHEVDVILLVDNAQQPMLTGPTAVLRNVISHGHDSKLAVVFTHFDQMVADNLRNDRAKQEHVMRSIENALGGIETDLGSTTVRGLRRHLQSRVFYAGNLDKNLETNPPGAKFTRTQLSRLFDLLAQSIEPAVVLTAKPVYDTANLILCIKAAVDRFHNLWDGRLGVTFRPGYRPEHWTRIKALARRFAEMGLDAYDTLMPVADLLRELTEGLANFVATPRFWKPMDAVDVARQSVIERVRRSLSIRLQELATSRIRVEPLASWQEAYRRSGRGSGTERSRDLWRIYLVGAPVLRETPAREASEFTDRIRQLFREAVKEAGGEVH